MTESVRRALPEDVQAIVALTIAEALEAEGLHLDAAAVRRGVEGAFGDPPRAAYWVAESPEGLVVASTSIVTEWSNFHGGEYWWVQSLYIAPAHRGRGLVERLLDRLWTEARAAGARDLRLYAHRANARALRVYERCGFATAPYVIMSRSTE
ncbi:MAG: GNAT family N-acetyltransferase [Acidobacteria bacterium]|nr:GNAT family N-acetyltransferase [Acidobacteriota bacterium]